MSIARKPSAPRLLAVVLLALAALLGLGGRAEAQGGHIRLQAEGGALVELNGVTSGGRELTGKFTVQNDGAGRLHVTRLAVRTSATDPRTPPGVTADFAGGGREATLDPGQRREVIVRWSTEGVRARQLYGHVLVESDAAGAETALPAAIGIHAERWPGLGFVGGHLLSIMVALPLLGVVAILLARLAGVRDDRKIRLFTVGLHAANLALGAVLVSRFDGLFTRADGNDGHQFVERAVWIRSLGAEWFVGVDGISVGLVFLTTLLAFVGALASHGVADRVKGYFALYDLAVAGTLGVLVSLDLFLFYLSWEVMLLPMVLLIGLFGGARRMYASVKLLLCTLAGSVFLLLAFAWFHQGADPSYLVDGAPVAHTASIPELSRVAWLAKYPTILGIMAVKVVWTWLFLAFAVALPMFPFHTWLPDAHAEAPTAAFVLLGGVLPAVGAYGILRLAVTLLPEATAWAAPGMAAFGVVNILYGALAALAQKDLKRLVAYATVSRMGFTLLAIGAMTPQGFEACLVQVFHQGLVAGMLSLLVGALHDRAHTSDLDRFGGLAGEMPRYAALVAFAFLASMGLPGLSGFWGEALALVGAFPRFRVLTLLAAAGVIVTAAVHVGALRRMLLGPFREDWRESEALAPTGGRFPEIDGREIAALAPLAVLVLVLGFWPRPLFDLLDRGVLDMHRLLDKPGPTQIAGAESNRPPAALALRGR